MIISSQDNQFQVFSFSLPPGVAVKKMNLADNGKICWERERRVGELGGEVCTWVHTCIHTHTHTHTQHTHTIHTYTNQDSLLSLFFSLLVHLLFAYTLSHLSSLNLVPNLRPKWCDEKAGYLWSLIIFAESWLCHFLAVKPWAYYLTSLCPIFLIGKM